MTHSFSPQDHDHEHNHDQEQEQARVHLTYMGDTRYPGPKVHLAPRELGGLPTLQELEAYPRMFTWGELKGIVRDGDLGRLGRNKQVQKRYDDWMVGIKAKYGSTEKYLRQCRLPFPHVEAHTKPTFHPSEPSEALDPNDHTSIPLPAGTAGTAGVVGGQTTGSSAVSGTSTPASVGFVSLSSLKAVNGKLRKSRRSGMSTSTPVSASMSPAAPASPASPDGRLKEDDDDDNQEGEEEEAVHLRYDAQKGLDDENYAVLLNDWPYNVPYGVRHYCVWSRLPIAHPTLVDYDPDAWAKIEEDGLGGFTGITPYYSPLAAVAAPAAQPGQPPQPLSPNLSNGGPSPSPAPTPIPIGRQGLVQAPQEGITWYDIDVSYSGSDVQQWAGKGYESPGGSEVGKMVRGLWDERGWECIWFVNPPRLQSIPGLAHFHVFARRKTPEEIDAAEARPIVFVGEVNAR